MPPGPLGPPPATKKSKRSLVLALLALLVVGAAVGSFLVFSKDKASAEIRLEPISATLPDDFADNLDLDLPGSSLALALPDVPPLGSGIGSALAGLQADGDEPGLFGGSRDVGVCDIDQLIGFLTDSANADKAEAWAGVLGVDVDGIEDFIRGLTAVRLRFDTRVTNHGFRSGTANAIQSVLEAGTAVLVDDEGVPRVKCNCGNPLLEPEPLGDLSEVDALDLDALAANPEDAWEGFDPVQVVIVLPAATPVTAFVLVDIDTGELFERPVGSNGDVDAEVDVNTGDICDKLPASPTCAGVGGDDGPVLGTGDVQITLEWSSDADLDLAVTDPTGDNINFGNRGPTATGGQLDVDSNVGCTNNGSVENIFWPPEGAPAGDYVVTITGFTVDGCGGGDYVLTIKVAGQDDQVETGSVGEDEIDEFTFSVD